MTRFSPGLGALLAAVLYLDAAHSQTDTYIHIDSGSGEFIGQGEEFTLTPLNGAFSVDVPNTENDAVTFNWTGDTWWDLRLQAPSAAALSTGNYEDAMRYGFADDSRPGLDFSGDGRGCNTLTGRFVVYEAAFTGPGAVDRFAADFLQACEGSTSGLFGRVRYNSTVPFEEGEPVADGGADLITMDGLPVSLDGTQSTTGTLATFTTNAWFKISGPGLTIQDGSDLLATASPENMVAFGESEANATVQLRLANTHNYTDTDTVSIRVVTKSGPQTHIYYDSPSGDPIGQGLKRFLGDESAEFTISQTDNRTVSISYDDGTVWNLQFAAPVDNQLDVGHYSDVVQVPMNIAEGGLNFEGNGNSCSLVSGSFDIHEFVVDGQDEVVSFSADFEQYCDGSTQALQGRVRYNSIDPSTPTADAGGDQRVVHGTLITLDAGASSDNEGSIVRYRWTQIDGESVSNVAGTDGAKMQFTSPAIPPDENETTVSFELRVRDSQGYEDTDRVRVTVVRAGESENVAESDDPFGDDDGGGAFGYCFLLGLITCLHYRRMSSTRQRRATGAGR